MGVQFLSQGPFGRVAEQLIAPELNHKDGDSSNHLLPNLEFLCPNCHSQTPTYRSRNIKFRRVAGGVLSGLENRAMAMSHDRATRLPSAILEDRATIAVDAVWKAVPRENGS